jgi:hypothetical protein
MENTAPPPITAASLLAKYSGESGTFPIVFADGTTLPARTITDAGEIEKEEAAAQMWARNYSSKKAPEWARELGLGFETCRKAYYVRSFMVEPAFTDREALECAKHAGKLLVRLYGEITLKLDVDYVGMEQDEIDTAKED